jgi:hypothetical protein
MTNEESARYVAALLEERRGYAARGLTDRVEAVDAELRRLGAQGKSPAKRSEKRGKKK